MSKQLLPTDTKLVPSPAMENLTLEEKIDGSTKAAAARTKSLEESQKSISETLARAKEVCNSIGAFDLKWKAFQDKVDQVLKNSLEGVRASMEAEHNAMYEDGSENLSDDQKRAVLGGSANLEAFCKVLGNAKSVVVLVGAGCSTSAGIPDFRTPGTGLYDNLQKYKLPTPESLFTLDQLRRDPKPFNTVAREMWPGKHSPTVAHKLIALLHKQKKLLRCYTQNIDGLERLAGVPDDKVVEAHGSFHSAHCIDCKEEENIQQVRSVVEKGEIPSCRHCGGIVKPDIVFFGEDLPADFRDMHKQDLEAADALVVIGTSLKVKPFSLLVNMVKPTVPRLLLNREPVGPWVCTCNFSASAMAEAQVSEISGQKSSSHRSTLPTLQESDEATVHKYSPSPCPNCPLLLTDRCIGQGKTAKANSATSKQGRPKLSKTRSVGNMKTASSKPIPGNPVSRSASSANLTTHKPKAKEIRCSQCGRLNYRDVCLLMDCDEGAKRLAANMKWTLSA